MTVTIKTPKGFEKSGDTVLLALDDARIFWVQKTSYGMFRFEESCDGHYAAFLTKDQVLALADELRALALSGD